MICGIMLVCLIIAFLAWCCSCHTRSEEQEKEEKQFEKLLKHMEDKLRRQLLRNYYKEQTKIFEKLKTEHPAFKECNRLDEEYKALRACGYEEKTNENIKQIKELKTKILNKEILDFVYGQNKLPYCVKEIFVKYKGEE
jgi:hypothetical protein